MKKFLSAKVSIARFSGDLGADLINCLNQLGGIKRFVKPGQRVFIKPNLTAGAKPDTGGTTDVIFVEEIIKILKEIDGIKIIVGEGAGNEVDTDEAFEKLGYKEMAAREGITLVNCDKTECCEVTLDDYLYKSKYLLPKVFLNSDIFISAPVLKTHVNTGITVALKNTFGLISDNEKMQAHRDYALEECLVDINRVKPADLVFVDGRIGSEGVAGGTDFSHPKEANMFLIGNDPVAVDAVSARLMKQNPRIRYIFWAQQQGVGVGDLDFIVIYGYQKGLERDFLTPGEQLSDQIDNLHIYDLGSCTGCRGVVDSVLARYGRRAFLNRINVFYGPEESSFCSNNSEYSLFVGDCVKSEYAQKDLWLPGCPPKSGELLNMLESIGILCGKCDNKAGYLLEIVEKNENYRKMKPYLRILAGGKEVFRGDRVTGKMDDLVIAMGDCQEGYIRNHRNRVKKLLNIDPAKCCKHLKGCPPNLNSINSELEDFFSFKP